MSSFDAKSDSPKSDAMAHTKVEQSQDVERNSDFGTGTVEPLTQLGLETFHNNKSRDLGMLEIIATGWNICNSWAAIAGTLAISVASGGPVTLIYGIMLIFVLSGSCALSMAEIASAYPTAGGQYHWTSILAPARYSRFMSYCCGSINMFGWIATTSGFILPFIGVMFALGSFWNPDFTPATWHVFLVYQLTNILFTMYNIFLLKKALWVQNIGFFLSLTMFFVITITCVAMSNPKQDNAAVWATFINTSGGLPDGIVFLTGLVNANFIYSGLDGAIHLAEECNNAAVAIPRALISTVLIGFVSALAFAVAMTYSYNDFDAVLASPFPAIEIWHQATNSNIAVTVFVITFTICGCFAVSGAIQTASRLTWSFARDDAIIGSRFLSRMHPTLDEPMWALLFNSFAVFVLGCVYLGSSTAFNALVSTGLILQQVSFAFPAGLVLWHRVRGSFDAVLPKTRSFRLPGFVGGTANVLCMVFGLLALVFYDFPVVLPVEAGNMNYACAVIGVMVILAAINWFTHARKRYHGPRLHEQ